MRFIKPLLLLVVLLAVGVWILVSKPFVLREETDEARPTYTEIISLPQHPPFWKGRSEHMEWVMTIRGQSDKGSGQLSRGDLDAATLTFRQVRASGRSAREKLSLWSDWRYGSVRPEAGAVKKLAEIAERLGRRDEAKKLRQEASSLEESAKKFAEDLDRFKADASWQTLKKEWITHDDRLFRLMAIHVASMGAANEQPGYDQSEVLAALEELAKNDPDPELKQWARQFAGWLDSLQN